MDFACCGHCPTSDHPGIGEHIDPCAYGCNAPYFPTEEPDEGGWDE